MVGDSSPRNGAAVLRGIAAVVAGLGAGELAAGLIPPHASPVAAVAGVLVDIAPTWATELGIQLFGEWDKVAIVVAIAIVVIALGALAGFLERSRPPAGTVIVVLLGVAGLVAAFARGGALTSAIPGLIGLVVAIVAFRLLPRAGLVRRRVASEAPVEDTDALAAPAGPQLGRRTFLAWAGGLTIAGALAAAGGAAMSGLVRARSAVASALRLPVAARPAPAIPAAAELGIPGLAPVVTPVADFYRVDTAFVVPTIAPEDWRLRIHGRAEREVELGWDELMELEFEEFDVTLMCVSNPVGGPYTGNARWLGTRLRPLLERAGPQPEADMVLSQSADGWTASTPLDVLLEPDRSAILAVAMNGVPLPPEHGAPVRMVVPGLYGYVSATKWVTDLELTRFDEKTAYWTRSGWAARGPVKLQSRIDVPRPGNPLPAGPTQIAGVAWHQHVGIARVEVRIGQGPWLPAELAEAIGIDTWVQWRFAWDAPPGVHTLAVRAIGADGEVQTGTPSSVLPDGATGYHSFSVRVED
ncbi:MAG TPA: molybdopterin-dependent oxidoreductase [Microbacteriaceae bacterium]|nr:molybdopterin-dependent oxidoreductase [Microbacteriaceae bacterium]